MFQPKRSEGMKANFLLNLHRIFFCSKDGERRGANNVIKADLKTITVGKTERCERFTEAGLFATIVKPHTRGKNRHHNNLRDKRFSSLLRSE